MKGILNTIALSSCLFGISEVSALGRLETEIRYPTDANGFRSDAGAGKIEIILKNSGDLPLEVDSRSVPATNAKGVLFDDVLDVRSTNGAMVRFRGIYYSTLEGAEGDYLTIPPGKTRVFPLDVSLTYRLEAGSTYAVTTRPLLYLPRSREQYREATPRSIVSAMSRSPSPPSKLLWMDPRRLASTATATPIEERTPCSDDEVFLFNAAKTKAADVARAAMWHYNDLFSAELIPHPPFMEFEFDASDRYTKWFGVDPHASMEDWDEDDKQLAGMLLKLPERLTSSLMTSTCQCSTNDVKDPDENVAWVEINTHYVVNVCPNFWLFEDFPQFKGQGTRVGTLIHEASHFEDSNDLDWAQDYVKGYDESGALSANRSLAVRNADNYKYYVLNPDW